METGEAYLEADFDSHLTSYESGGFKATARFPLRSGQTDGGGAHAYYVKAESPEPVELQPNAKWQVFETKLKGWRGTGVILYVPITQRAGSDTFGSVYGTVSKSKRHARRAIHGRGVYADRAGGRQRQPQQAPCFGYEQPCTRS